jgi:phosphonate transport system substrate-binding protein
MKPGRTRSRWLAAALGMTAAVALAGGHPPVRAATAGELRIAFIPQENPDKLVKDVRPVAEDLGRRLGVKVIPSVVLDYAAVVEALRANRADVAFMGPLQYVLSHQHSGATAILGEKYNGKPTYQAKIFVRKDSGLRSLADLKGKRIAFVDPISSSGYMYPLSMFREAGVMPAAQKPESYFRRIYFAGGDEQAIRAVHNRFADAAGVSEYSLLLLRPEERDSVVAIATSKPIRSHCVVVRRGLDPQLVEKIKSYLLSLERGPNKQYLKALNNVDGYVSVTHETYAPVEAMAKEYGFLR